MMCKTYAIFLVILLVLISLLVEIQCQCQTHNPVCVRKKGQDQVGTIIRMLKKSFNPRTQIMKILLTRYTITNTRISKLTVASSGIKAIDPGSIAADIENKIGLTIGGIAMQVNASWKKKNLFWTDRGHFKATMSDSFVYVTYPKTSACTSPKLLNFGCSVGLNNFNLKITGRMIGLVFRKEAPKRFQDIIKKALCSSASNVLADLLPKWSC